MYLVVSFVDYTLRAEVRACDRSTGKSKQLFLFCFRILRCALKNPKGRLIIFKISIDPEVT